MSEYKKVEDMSVGEVVDAILNGDKFYYCDSSKPSYSEFTIKHVNLESGIGELYTRKELPWWEGCEGSVIMTRDTENEEWVVDIFKEKIGKWFICSLASWKQARPLTAAERDAIKVEG